MWTKSLCALAMMAVSASALAQVKTPPRRTGFYLLGTVGISQGNDDAASLDRAVANVGSSPSVVVDAKRVVFGGHAGYRMNDYFGFEIGALDLGRMTLRASGTTTFSSITKIRGAQAALVGYLPAGEDASVYAKFGGVWARTQYEGSDGFKDTTTVMRSYWALGLQMHFNETLFGRLEYVRYNNLGSTYSGQAAFNHYNLGVGLLF